MLIRQGSLWQARWKLQTCGIIEFDHVFVLGSNNDNDDEEDYSKDHQQQACLQSMGKYDISLEVKLNMGIEIY